MNAVEILHKVQEVDASALGKGMIGAATGMTTLQFVTQFGSIVLIALNIILALGGIYLIYLKAKKERRRPKTGD